MDIEKLSRDGKSNLMTLTKSDLKTSSSSEDKKSTSSLMLLQLPEGWSPSELKHSQFVVAKPEQQAVLVCQQSSFYISNVETSNCLVMIPPLDTDGGDGNEGSPTKKAKHNNDSSSSSSSTNTKNLTVIPTRLLKPGGSGASFLELRPKKLRLADLRRALSAAVLDPYNGTAATNGRSLTNLSTELQQSAHEVSRGLQKLPGVYALSASDFCLLSEELQLTVYHAILSTLAEADGCQDYSKSGLADVDGFIKATVDSMSSEERFDQASDVIRHCLLQLAVDQREQPLRLNVAKVARWVARRLFSIQSNPWEETLFLARWQSQLPGVGNVYQVSTDMLRGLAVPTSDAEEERFWKFLPAEEILGPMGEAPTESAFDALFEWKEKWQLDELQPYLDAIVDATGASQADLLIQYTKTMMEEFKGMPVKVYRKR